MRKLAWLAMAALAACSSTGGTGGAGGAAAPTTPTASARVWPVLTRQHVDLWLHGYALLLRDTSVVPVFRRGYRERAQTARTQRGISTMLDANRERLQSRLAISPALFNGQFVPLYFANWDRMRQMISLFIQAQGNPQAAGDQATAQAFAVLRQSFGTQADRDWLRLFTQSLEDEQRQFYQLYWSQENGSRIGLIREADSLWHTTYRPKFTGFLNNTQQETGSMVLALTLGGEGRTVNYSSRLNEIAVTMPEQDAREALYVFAHEIVGSIVATAVNDNITPTEQRTGVAATLVPTGQVRAGAMLLQRIAPELVAGYTRYYLSQGGFSTTGDTAARLVSSYPLPDMIREAIDRQLNVVLGGI
jgi:hypothetical protein